MGWLLVALPLLQGLAAATLPVWPQPQKYTAGEQTIVLSSDFTVSSDAEEPAKGAVLKAGERFSQRAFLHASVEETVEDVAAVLATTGAQSTLEALSVSVEQADADLQLGVDESYTLDIPADGGAILKAKTVYGAYHGLETLSQLIVFDFDSGVYQIEGLPLHIEDAPRFPHRGLLIDSGRHFEPVMEVKAVIDSMAMAKINTLHWHLTEVQSFPAPSRVHPELAEKGAFSPDERYTWGEVKDIVAYAKARGIRVMPEFDMPGHSGSWRKSHPELFPSSARCEKDNALDPAKPEVYKFIEELLKDWAGVFTDKVMHIGTDEVPEACWNNTEDLAYMKNQGLVSLDELFGLFVGRLASIVEGVGKRPAMWDESIIRATAPGNAIVQIWHSDPGLLQKALELGNDAVYSPDSASGWYLDGLKVSWEKMYEVEPEAGLDMNKTKGKVLGGEGCMWGESVDPSDMENTVWPRLAAIAERLWSPLAVTSAGSDAARERLQDFRCLLLHRGVRAGLVGLDGRASPPGPGGCRQAKTRMFKDTVLI